MAWTTIFNLNTKCNEIDRPFYEALIQGRFEDALGVLEGMDEKNITNLIEEDLNEIIVAICGVRPLHEVERWWEVRQRMDLRLNIFTDAMIQAIGGGHLDTAQYVYDLDPKYNRSYRYNDIARETVTTNNVEVVASVRNMLERGDNVDELLLMHILQSKTFPINNELFRFLDTFSTACLEKTKKQHEYEVGQQASNIFWNQYDAFKQRERLRMEVEQNQSMAVVAPKAKM